MPTLLLLACVAAVWGLCLHRPLIIERLELAAFDRCRALVRLPPLQQKVVAVIATDKSLAEVGEWPLPRGMHARVLGQLALARAVTVDFLFPETSREQDDRLLAATVERMGNVILAAHISADGTSGDSRLILPYHDLSAAAASYGFTNIRPDADGIYRNAYLFWGEDNLFVPSFPLAAWMAVTGDAPGIEKTADGYRVAFPGAQVETGPEAVFKVKHPHQEIPIYEYADVYKERVDPEVFRDALVFVGASAAGTDDFFPVGFGIPLVGVLFNAHAAMTLLHGWLPERAPVWLAVAAGSVMAAVGIALGMSQGGARAWLGLAASILLWLGVSGGIFLHYNLWLAPVLPALAALFAFALATRMQLRNVSHKLAVQRFSVDEGLFLGRREFDPRTTSFAQYLTDNWDQLGRMSGFDIVVPSASAADPEVGHCLDRLRENGDAGDRAIGAQVSVISDPGGTNRLLLRHPIWEGDEERYTVLSWKGKKKFDELKSVSVLVLSAATHFRAIEESMAKRELFLGVIRLIMRAVDAKDPTTAGHSERVAMLARELAKKMGLSPPEVDDIYLGGLLHDVGKIGIPDNILNFPGRLSDEDMEVMRKHPRLGAEMMGSIKLPESVLRGILEHHERLDGAGYPHGHRDERLSVAGKILKVADVFDALRSKRQYKEPMCAEKVYAILSQGAGTEFDAAAIARIMEEPFTDLYES